MRRSSNRQLVVPWIAVVGCGACATPPEPPTQAEITHQAVVEATVQAIDPATREVTLERSDGSVVTVVAGPEVRNFDAIAVGNKVKAEYVESLFARRLGPDEVGSAPAAAVTAERAAPGAAPAGAVGVGVAMTVRIESVDLDQHLVVFSDPSGLLRVFRAQRDEGRRFIAGLSPGDRVELAYGEVLVLRVE